MRSRECSVKRLDEGLYKVTTQGNMVLGEVRHSGHKVWTARTPGGKVYDVASKEAAICILCDHFAVPVVTDAA
jgi:hypothetical protein